MSYKNFGANSTDQFLRTGRQALEAGDWDMALRTLRQAVALAPDHPAGRNLLGAALLQTGHAEAAIPEFEQAARLARNDPGILANLGRACAEAGRHDAAHQAFLKASRIMPGNVHYAEGAAIALAGLGRFDEAAALLQRLTARFPAAATPWYNLGNVRREQRDLAAAEHCYREALARAPEDWLARNNLGSVLQAQMRFDAAIAEYRACIAVQPQAPAPRLNLVSALIDVGEHSQAEETCRALLRQTPQWSQAHRFLAVALRGQGHITAALSSFTRAAALAPDDALICRGHANALAQAGATHQALRELARAVRLNAAEAAGLAEIGVLLPHGLFADGWAAYRHRPNPAALYGIDTAAALAPILPSQMRGQSVAILPEQGLGDELFFLRYAPLLRARGARVTVYTNSKIAALVARSNCADQVVEALVPTPGAVAAKADLRLFCGDLPFALGNSPASTVSPRPGAWTCRDYPICINIYYPPLPLSLRIPALAPAQERMRQRLAAYGPPPYLGITWRAGTAVREQRADHWMLSKEIPLTVLATALQGWPGTLLALQRKPAANELETLAQLTGKPLHDCTDLNDDLEAMLALLGLIDEYVGVSNTNMHLRAAVGRVARVLVPQPPEWRWMHAGRESPWFPGFTIYRQSLDGEWDAALQALARDL